MGRDGGRFKTWWVPFTPPGSQGTTGEEVTEKEKRPFFSPSLNQNSGGDE